MTKQLNQPSVTVRVAISCDGVKGLVFFDGNVDCLRYLDMLMEVAMQQLQARPDSAESLFQQDGTPTHYSLAVRPGSGIPVSLNGGAGEHWVTTTFPGLNSIGFLFLGSSKVGLSHWWIFLEDAEEQSASNDSGLGRGSLHNSLTTQFRRSIFYIFHQIFHLLYQNA
ncbi:hypothetical protein TNCV_2882341 [Trichonephila clavipes]|nr:hypothetical protein TNCV_2882341 [Trichonephila clavipes]